MNHRVETLCLSVLMLSCAVTATAAECLPVAKAAWIRLPPVAMPMMGGFARIENPCKATVSIVGAESLAFDDVSLHETREENGVSRMREVTALPVAPGKGALATFSPLLDGAGNSIRGVRAASFLSRALGLDLFASRAAAPASERGSG